MNKLDVKSSRNANGFTRRDFINGVAILSLFGVCGFYFVSDNEHTITEHSDLFLLNGWLARKDDYEILRDVGRF